MDFENNQIAEKFLKLHELSKSCSSYKQVINKLSNIPATEWKNVSNEVTNTMIQLRETFLKIRSYLRTMSEKAKVDIEPKSQTELLDATMSLNGVLFAGVPGAGGYDAIFCITFGDETRSRVEQFWTSYSKFIVCPLLLNECSEGLKQNDELLG